MNLSDSRSGLFSRVRIRPGLAFAFIILAALCAFEMFNYSTTEYALKDLLGNLKFMEISWSTILSIAFCGIDFAGIARLFTPEQGSGEPKEVWYLFGAWLLAATMNAVLTWWGVAIAILSHESLGGEVVSRATMLKVVPLFVAIMVWLIRVLIIGAFSMAGDTLFSMADTRVAPQPRPYQSTQSMRPSMNQMPSMRTASSLARPSSNFHPAPKPPYEKREPTYHDVAMEASSREDRSQDRLM